MRPVLLPQISFLFVRLHPNKRHVRLAKNHVDEFTGSVSRAAQFAFWERMFSLWHIIHVPLFFLLLVSGVIHVVAVHLY